MAKKTVYRAKTSMSDKDGQLISAGETVTEDQFTDTTFNRLFKELKAIEKVEADEAEASPDSGTAADRDAMIKSLSRKTPEALSKQVEAMRKEGWIVEFAEKATKDEIINAIADARKGE